MIDFGVFFQQATFGPFLLWIDVESFFAVAVQKGLSSIASLRKCLA